MASINHIEQRIFDVDGVRAVLSGPVSGLDDYWVNRYNGDNTVSDFRARFAGRYPGVDIMLLDGIGRGANGNYLMKNLRATYDYAWIEDRVELYAQYIAEQQARIEALEQALAQAGASTQPEPDPYEILGVARDGSDAEIKEAYQRKIRCFHPDRLSGLDDAIIRFGNERAQSINRAREQIAEERREAA